MSLGILCCVWKQERNKNLLNFGFTTRYYFRRYLSHCLVRSVYFCVFFLIVDPFLDYLYPITYCLLTLILILNFIFFLYFLSPFINDNFLLLLLFSFGFKRIKVMFWLYGFFLLLNKILLNLLLRLWDNFWRRWWSSFPLWLRYRRRRWLFTILINLCWLRNRCFILQFIFLNLRITVLYLLVRRIVDVWV